MKRSIVSEDQIIQIIKDDPWMIQVLRAAEDLNLPDWWIGAGFLRNKIWDYLEGNDFQKSRDIDLVYFDMTDLTPEKDHSLDSQMNEKYPFATWEIRNQARMSYYSDMPPFKSTKDGISHWVETATCIGVRLASGKFEFLFCYGTEDLFNLTARAVDIYDTPERIQTFYTRVEKKKWTERWPDLKVIAKTEKPK